MSKHIVTAVAALVIATTAWAAPVHGKDRAKPGTHDPAAVNLRPATATTESVVPELEKIVVLCANDEKKEFEKEWRQYVGKNDLKGAKLKETIAFVSKEAAALRKKEGKIRSGKAEAEWAQERQRLMEEVARRAMNPAR
ncbi:MAG: hypothetical protein R3348_02800 [Xanthomonadales bacterium]|nr:hypothetical protein [Xanthomonadales bacterium]